MWPLKSKEREIKKEWGRFKVYDECPFCECTSTDTPFEEFKGDKICPGCGNVGMNTVIGRWKTSKVVLFPNTWTIWHEFERKKQVS